MRKLKSNLGQTKQGFTLIELMLVIAVIGILAVVSVPKYQAVTDNYRLQASAETAVAQIRYAKQMAMDGRKNIYVGFTSHEVRLYVQVSGSYVDLGKTEALEGGVEFAPAQSLGLVEITASVYAFSYNPRGFVQAGGGSGGSAATIELKSVRTDRRVTINVESGTGYATYSY